MSLDYEVIRACIAEASLAPTVHNIQPTRWQFTGKGLRLLGDAQRQLPVADPSGHDVLISHGAALEGLDIALKRHGLAVDAVQRCKEQARGDGLIDVADVEIVERHSLESVDRAVVERRASWRGGFARTDDAVAAACRQIAASRDDLTLVMETPLVADIAMLADRAGMHFLRDADHRRELLSWMRLSDGDPRYMRDGLNREAMALGRIEAWGAGHVLGSWFGTLDGLGLANSLLSERAKTLSSAAIALFHRPHGEHPLESGRAFYRAWLAITAGGLAACPMSVLADWDVARSELQRRHPLGEGWRLVNVLRVGRAPVGSPQPRRARLPLDELIVEARA